MEEKETRSPRGRLSRTELPGWREDRLFFAQVREDPRLEIDALAPLPGAKVIVVSSGGCTALSLLAAGAGHVTAVDLNAAQNHLVELKVAALRSQTMPEIMSFFGVARGTAERRMRTYRTIRPLVSERAAEFWDARQDLLGRGALACGVSEQFISAVVKVVKLLIHGRRRIERLLALESLEEQREFFDREWNTRRWRLLFPTLLNRWTFNRTYDPAFFREVENPSFATHFRLLLEHALCEVLRTRLNCLDLVDGGYGEYLATLEDSSVDALALSNICEWLDQMRVERLFEQVLRVARPGARFCFRNFVGHTEIPQRFRGAIVEDPEAGRRAMFHDRSCLQSRFVICRIAK
jgi:S-adenosylmethionine-diacylglycerol 3-amino-3-carboxypropyl transferase